MEIKENANIGATVHTLLKRVKLEFEDGNYDKVKQLCERYPATWLISAIRRFFTVII